MVSEIPVSLLIQVTKWYLLQYPHNPGQSRFICITLGNQSQNTSLNAHVLPHSSNSTHSTIKTNHLEIILLRNMLLCNILHLITFSVVQRLHISLLVKFNYTQINHACSHIYAFYCIRKWNVLLIGRYLVNDRLFLFTHTCTRKGLLA